MLGYVVIVIVCLLGSAMGFSPVNTGRGELSILAPYGYE